MTCKNCGAAMEDDAVFCAKCGIKLDAEQAEQPKQPEQLEAEKPCVPVQAESARRYNGFAICGFVCSFLMPILGIVFSCIGMKQCKEFGDDGRPLAIAGLVISIVSVGISLLLFMTGACAITNIAMRF